MKEDYNSPATRPAGRKAPTVPFHVEGAKIACGLRLQSSIERVAVGTIGKKATDVERKTNREQYESANKKVPVTARPVESKGGTVTFVGKGASIIADRVGQKGGNLPPPSKIRKGRRLKPV